MFQFPAFTFRIISAGKLCIFLLIAGIFFASCEPHKVCSGLNPEIGKYNTSKKIRKARRHSHSGPERTAINQRKKQMKKKKEFSAKKGRHGKGGFFHLGGGGSIGSSGGNGGGGYQQQQRNDNNNNNNPKN